MSLLLIWFCINSNCPQAAPSQTQLINRPCSLPDLSLILPTRLLLLSHASIKSSPCTAKNFFYKGSLNPSVFMAVSRFSEAMQPYILSLDSLFPTMSLCLRQSSQLFNPVAWYEHMQLTGVLLPLRQGMKCGTELAASVQPIAQLGHSRSHQPGKGLGS